MQRKVEPAEEVREEQVKFCIGETGFTLASGRQMSSRRRQSPMIRRADTLT